MDATILPIRPRRRVALITGLVMSFVIGSAGVSAAALRYDDKHSSEFLDGVSIGGVSVGGRSFFVAEGLLAAEFEAPLDRKLTFNVAGQTFTATPRELGLSNDWKERFADGRALASSLPLWKRLMYRFANREFGKGLDVSPKLDESRSKEFIEKLATKVDRAPVDAKIGFENESLQITPDTSGFSLDREGALKTIKSGLLDGGPNNLELAGNTVPANVPQSKFDTVLIVRVGENKLFHYRNRQLVKVYEVATGKSNEPTPKGLRFVIRKRKNPTWFNPAKSTWGRNMPASIPPGPRNPLGSRVLDMNGTLARIHATFRLYSIGYNDSQGCIRMRPNEIEELFDQVDVGTPVLILQSGPNRPLKSAPPVSPDEPSAENDAGAPTSGGGGEPAPPPAEPEPQPPGPTIPG